MSTSKIEFAVQMTCESCAQAVRKSLNNEKEIKNVDVNLSTSSVIVETSLSADYVLEKILTSGRKAVIRGYGSSAGVAIMDTGSQNIKGVVRFVQESENVCTIDGTVDGLEPGKYTLSIHECGDVSNGCSSVGNFFNPNRTNINRIYGDLGHIEATNAGKSVFKFDDKLIKLSEIIGRALVISDGNKRLSCGIIARSAGLFQNPKMICACDGITIWKENIAQAKSTL